MKIVSVSRSGLIIGASTFQAGGYFHIPLTSYWWKIVDGEWGKQQYGLYTACLIPVSEDL